MTTRYASWADVLDYCRRSANPVGRLVLRIAGYRDEALDRSSDALCTALQLTNFWQDFGRDWRAGRLYVPREVVRRVRRARSRPGERPDRRRRGAGRSDACVGRHARAVRRGPRGLRRRPRPPARRAALHLARRHADPRARRTRTRGRCSSAVRRSAPPTLPVLLWRASRWNGGATADGAQDQLLLLVPRAAGRPAAGDRRRLGFLPRRGRCGGRGSARSARAMPTGREAVPFWRAELARCYDGAAPATPQGRRLQPFVRRFDLPRQAFEDVIDGVAMDLDTIALRRRSTISSSTAAASPRRSGMICIRIFGCRTPRARDYALNLGVALQLTNILRDIKDDLARGRVYLPLEDLAACGCTVDDLARRHGDRAGPAPAGVRVRAARATSTQRAVAVAARRGPPPARRRRDHAGGVLRDAAAHRAQRLRRVRGARARAEADGRRCIALRQWLWPAHACAPATSIVIGAGFAGLSAAVRLAERRRARARARGALAAGRARDGVRRPRDRRARRQRPARAARLLHRDVRVPAPTSARSATCGCSRSSR